MDFVEFLKLFLAPSLTVLGFIFIYNQLRVAQNAAEKQKIWKEYEFVANQMKDFFSDETIERTTVMLDWYLRKIRFPSYDNNPILCIQDTATFNNLHDFEREINNLENDYIANGRFVIVSKALRIHDSERFEGPEAAVRDDFDWLLTRIGQFQFLSNSCDIPYSLIYSQICYILDLISGKKSHVSHELVINLNKYIDFYDFKLARELLDKREQYLKSVQLEKSANLPYDAERASTS
ncbi:hypothetical protein [Methylocella sp.]|uniref:hypothetical protein n=1 Tax=Methylocella sp. TaxID=1978226 RepID=UPI0037832207